MQKNRCHTHPSLQVISKNAFNIIDLDQPPPAPHPQLSPPPVAQLQPTASAEYPSDHTSSEPSAVGGHQQGGSQHPSAPAPGSRPHSPFQLEGYKGSAGGQQSLGGGQGSAGPSSPNRANRPTNLQLPDMEPGSKGQHSPGEWW